MDLPGNARSLLGDGPPELGEADRAPHADEQKPVGEQAQKVTLRDEVARDAWRENVVQLGEEGQGRSEGEPAVEILAEPAVTNGEADHRHEREERQQRVGGRELERTAVR